MIRATPKIVTSARFQSTTAGDVKEILRNAKPFKDIPGQTVFPLLGTAWQMFPPFNKNFDLRRSHRVHAARYKEYGPIWKDVVPGKGTIVYLADVNDVEKLFRLDGKMPNRLPFQSVVKYRKDRPEVFPNFGLLGENGEAWWRLRSRTQPSMLKPQNTLLYLQSMADIAKQLADKIRCIRDSNNQVPDDFLTEINKWALESVALVALDTELGCISQTLAPDSEPHKMIEATHITMRTLHKLERGMPPIYWKNFPTRTYKELESALDCFVQIAVKYIKQALAKMDNQNGTNENKPLTILQHMLKTDLTVQESVAMTIDALIAGIDTTSNSSAFVLYHLATNPGKQAKLQREIDQLLPSKDAPITSSALNEMHYLKACIKESLRLKPASVFLARLLKEDTVFSGYFVPKRTLVFPSVQLIARLEKYFEKPDSFIPERWMKGSNAENVATPSSPFLSLPFGHGTRSCIGRRLAEQEMQVLIIQLMRQYDLEYHGPEIDCYTGIVNVPDQPLRFRFSDRK